MKPQSDELLLDFMSRFYGYGNLSGPNWLVGKEEGLRQSGPNVIAHLQGWHAVGRPVVADLVELQRIKGEGRCFGDKPVSHTMWKKLARVTLASRTGVSPSNEDVLTFQATQLGRRGGETAMLELLPLPAPRVSAEDEDWPYSDLTDIPELQTRAKYTSFCVSRRTQQLRAWLDEYRPRWVLFCSTDAWYIERWQEIAGVDLRLARIGGRPVRWGMADHTLFVVIANPAAPGISNAFLDAVGVAIHEAT